MEKLPNEMQKKAAKSGCCGCCGGAERKQTAGKEPADEKAQPATPLESPGESCCGS